MTLKKLVVVGMVSLGFSGFALAADIAVNGDQTKSVTADYAVTAGNFVVTPFQYTVSASVMLNSVENPVAFAVGSASKKGRTPYTGSSNGGSVSVCGTPTTGSAVPDSAPTPSLADEAVSGCLIVDPDDA
jgi:hypothetical protein